MGQPSVRVDLLTLVLEMCLGDQRYDIRQIERILVRGLRNSLCSPHTKSLLRNGSIKCGSCSQANRQNRAQENQSASTHPDCWRTLNPAHTVLSAGIEGAPLSFGARHLSAIAPRSVSDFPSQSQPVRASYGLRDSTRPKCDAQLHLMRLAPLGATVMRSSAFASVA